MPRVSLVSFQVYEKNRSNEQTSINKDIYKLVTITIHIILFLKNTTQVFNNLHLYLDNDAQLTSQMVNLSVRSKTKHCNQISHLVEIPPPTKPTTTNVNGNLASSTLTTLKLPKPSKVSQAEPPISSKTVPLWHNCLKALQLIPSI